MASKRKSGEQGYKPETLQKAIDLMNEKIAFYQSVDPVELFVAISSGNRKIGRVMNVSIAPVITCANCRGCKRYCYDIKAVLQYGNVLNARARNTVLATKYRDRFFEQIDAAMNRRRKNKFFRWHVAGELLDYDYLCRIIDNARRHPDFTIWTYTKHYGLVNLWIARNGKDALPSNLHIMFSEWAGMPMINPYGMPEFRVRMNPSDPAPAQYKCPGNCDICKQHCRGCVVGETTFADLH